MSFEQRIKEMVGAVERGDGTGVRACFTDDGIYHDVFYGDFRGDAIADMITNYFHRDASDFRWDIHDAVEQNGIGYARYVFSYLPQTEGAAPGRTIFEGTAICRMQGDLIADYSEIANAAVGLHAMGFAPERLAKFVAKQGAELRGRAESARHLS
ncbi:MAG: nuclear transport factor 2 family protein [Hyphomicrobiaceae bacterium]